MNYLEKVRNYLNTVHPAAKFFIRIAYPITLYIIMYFIAKGMGINNIQAVQLLFVLIWSFTEYFVFFRK